MSGSLFPDIIVTKFILLAAVTGIIGFFIAFLLYKQGANLPIAIIFGAIVGTIISIILAILGII